MKHSAENPPSLNSCACASITVQVIQPSRQVFAALEQEFGGFVEYYHLRDALGLCSACDQLIFKNGF
jgi:hypothetical protein